MKKILGIVTVLLWAGTLPLTAGNVSLERAKVMLFDQKWQSALVELDKCLASNPDGKDALQAIFYRGTCLKELDRTSEAVAAFQQFLAVSENAALREEAEINMVDLNVELLKRKDKLAPTRLKQALSSKDKSVRYYAAFKLSYLNDKSLAREGIPVLKGIVNRESDNELRERAKLALFRIDPRSLENVNKTDRTRGRMLRIRVVDKHVAKGQNPERVSISIPLSLATLALTALPDSEKKRLAAEGYNLDTIIQTLIKTREVVRIEDKEATIRIWID
jgi:tetratricopeptide (TPR) repeat protein